jgi:hypothetical protein
LNKIFDYKIKKIHLWERFLLLFKRPTYVVDSDGHIKCKIGYKHLFGKTYITNENISVKREKEVE